MSLKINTLEDLENSTRILNFKLAHNTKTPKEVREVMVALNVVYLLTMALRVQQGLTRSDDALAALQGIPPLRLQVGDTDLLTDQVIPSEEQFMRELEASFFS